MFVKLIYKMAFSVNLARILMIGLSIEYYFSGPNDL